MEAFILANEGVFYALVALISFVFYAFGLKIIFKPLMWPECFAVGAIMAQIALFFARNYYLTIKV